jgi:lysophospholipase L1-like esterase
MNQRRWNRMAVRWVFVAILPLSGRGPVAQSHAAAAQVPVILSSDVLLSTSRADGTSDVTGQVLWKQLDTSRQQPDGGDRMSKSVRIVALGDSITNGAGLAGTGEADTFREIVRRELAENLKVTVEVINAGVNGDIVTQALRRLDRDVLSKKPDIVTVMFGGNEAGFFRPETRGFADTPRVDRKVFSTTVAEIVKRVQATGSTVVLMTCPPMTERYWGMHLDAYRKHGINFLVKDYAQAMRDVARQTNVELIDVYRAFETNPAAKDYFPDGLHPDSRGHRLIADLLTERLARILGGKVGKRE